MTPRATARRLIPTGVAAIALAGCGITNPYQSSHTTTSGSSTTAPASTSTSTAPPRPRDLGDPPPERGGTIPAAQRAAQRRLATGAGSATPQAALDRYARVYVNWKASDVAGHQRQLAAISLGQARAQALQAAASARADTELTRSHVTNHGQLVAISHGTAAAGGVWVLVTRETTTGQGDYAGLPPTLHVTYAQVTHTPAGWVISQWSPQT